MKKSTKKNLIGIWESNLDWKIQEDYLNESQQKTEVDGKNILAIVEGVFFVPDGKSRNERFYPRGLWEKQLADPEVSSRLKERRMLGCIGHSDREVNEEDITEGKVSHIVSDLWIDESTGLGMGRTLILGTQAGRNLYTLMKAGCKIKTSSRASGDFKNETHEGLPVVDEDSYFLETFDFVINPGFLETDPMLKESVEKIKRDMKLKDIQNKETNDMEFGKELLEHVKNENASIKAELETVKEEKAVLTNKSAELSEQVAELSETKQALEETKTLVEKLETEKVELSEKFTAVSEELNSYKEACENITSEELSSILKESADITEAYVKLGKPSEISKKLKEHAEFVELCKDLELGEGVLPSELGALLSVIEETLSKVSELGTLEEIQEIMKRAEALTESIKKEKFEDLTVKISRQFKAPVENVKKLLESVGEKQTVSILSALSESTKKTVKAEKVQKTIDEEVVEVAQPKKSTIVSEMFRRNRYSAN